MLGKEKQRVFTFVLLGMLGVTLIGWGTDILMAQEAAVEPAAAPAEAAAPAADEPEVTPEMFTVNNVWMMVATFLVFIMHLGFATLESGLTRAKNTVNILFKNTMIISIGLLTYALIGFNAMYPGDWWMDGYLGDYFAFGINPGEDGQTSAYNVGYTYYTDFLFQGMFAATAATIISGAVAERIKLGSFLVITTLYVVLVYPVVGSWKWGGGWLDGMGFYDFAGSTLVHSVGGWGALVGVILLGPRIGKYGADGTVKPIFGSNMPMATIGVFLLWLGWFGFNGGSVLSADPDLVSFTLVTTSLAAAAGVIGAAITSSIVGGKADLSMALNGALAGLVGITAGADSIQPIWAILVGLVAGILVVISVIGLDKLKLDDPVGAISVHLTCGIWGTLAVGLFSSNPDHSFVVQLIGVVAAGVFCLVMGFILFFVVKLIMGIRVSEEEEIKGLDIEEHGVEAYGGFQIINVD